MKSERKKGKMKEKKNKVDWEGIVEVILKILTIGLYHVKKHRNNHETARE